MDLKPYANRWVILGAFGIAGTLLLITLIAIGWTSPRFSPTVGFAPADLTIIPAPTNTPQFVPTPTIDPNIPTATLAANTIGIGGYVFGVRFEQTHDAWQAARELVACISVLAIAQVFEEFLFEALEFLAHAEERPPAHQRFRQSPRRERGDSRHRSGRRYCVGRSPGHLRTLRAR